MKIVQPLPERSSEVWTPSGPVIVRPYQIILSISIAVNETLDAPETMPRFPVILDTGMNHNLAIRQSQLVSWAQARLPYMKDIRVAGSLVPIYRAGVWIHPNSGKPFKLELEDGIAVYPNDVTNPARLPILGLRAIARNDLKLIVESERKQVTLKTKWWF